MTQHRDTTRALAEITRVRNLVDKGRWTGILQALDRIERILIDMDARTGRRDPTVRKAAKKRGDQLEREMGVGAKKRRAASPAPSVSDVE